MPTLQYEPLSPAQFAVFMNEEKPSPDWEPDVRYRLETIRASLIHLYGLHRPTEWYGIYGASRMIGVLRIVHNHSHDRFADPVTYVSDLFVAPSYHNEELEEQIVQDMIRRAPTPHIVANSHIDLNVQLLLAAGFMQDTAMDPFPGEMVYVKE